MKKLWVPSSQVLHVRPLLGTIWTPQGIRDLGDVLDVRDFKPCFLGTFDFHREESPALDEVEYRPPRPLEDERCPFDIY